MPEPLHPVFDQHGRQIGTVQRIRIASADGHYWLAVSLDGCDLGAHRDRDDAHIAIQDDWEAGRPRDPAAPRRRFRPILARLSGVQPVFLGR